MIAAFTPSFLALLIILMNCRELSLMKPTCLILFGGDKLIFKGNLLGRCFIFLTNQRLESDEIQVDLSSQSDTGPWLVLHTITNLVEHLRLDFMKEIR